MIGGRLLGAFGPSGGSSRGMHHGMVAIGLKAFTPTDRMAAVLPHRDKLLGECSVLTSHHACHSRTSTREYDYLGPVPECLRAATGQHLSQPAGSPLRLLLGDGYTEEQLLIKSQGLDPPPKRNGRYLLSVHGKDLPAQNVSGLRRSPCARGEATYQRGGHVLAVGPWI